MGRDMNTSDSISIYEWYGKKNWGNIVLDD